MRIHFLGDPIPIETTYGVYLMSTEPSAAPWRVDALRLLSEHSFAGDVYVPAPRPDSSFDEAARLAWQESALNQADCVLATSSTTMNACWDLEKYRHRAKVILNADLVRVHANMPGVRTVATLEDA